MELANIDYSDINRRVKTVIDDLPEITVSDMETQKRASDVVIMLKGKQKEVEDYFKPYKDAAHKVHKDICTKEKEILGIVDLAVKKFDTSIREFLREQERIRREEERKRLEEEERMRLEEAKRMMEEEAKQKLDDGDIFGAIEAESVAKTIEEEKKSVHVSEESVIANEPAYTRSFSEKGSMVSAKEIQIEITNTKRLLSFIIEKGISDSAFSEIVKPSAISIPKLKTYLKLICDCKDVPGVRITEEIATQYKGKRTA